MHGLGLVGQKPEPFIFKFMGKVYDEKKKNYKQKNPNHCGFPRPRSSLSLELGNMSWKYLKMETQEENGWDL